MSFRNYIASARAFALISFFALSGFLGASSPASARTGAATARDGNSIQLGDVTYRLDGVDAPELDQVCIDDHADAWTCGIEARDQLTKLIKGRVVRCDDVGPEKSFGKRHRAICTAEGDKSTLNEQLVRLGFAVAREPIKANVKPAAAEAKTAAAGIWKGCFVAPQDFRAGKKDGTLLGAACRPDRDKEIRAVLFPEELTMPPSCSIKGKLAVRARVTGNIGIYHLRGCPSYPATTRPDRWFCSEDDAQAAGFRKAYNCRRSK
ncbi:endonuclease YncB(thermonuclease family) [Bradyrhizobium sp. R2.2-H]|jgi:endonuclease YncB( thermonuclease family)|uniref:thermonuclease family protein n=1 Tax=unclassified Bradyrhizobium TaxID=2631580 RepID=UPI0010445C7F|nr:MULTISPECIES: thermonuclease family protein [unclassified Bradyrhizobium]TCU78665.1 endonuclease YncB(thermonuclease family) [Bradyrhizobium sp. Y-H1]TCU80748.1 endonuclease YncB(thermonuclease family) [Bradyrhizobium sp. R2.2-H]